LLAALAACAVVAVVPATAAAAPGAGSASLTLGGSGKAAEALADGGVKAGSIAPAKKRGQRITLPVQTVTVGSSATVALRGGIRFKAGERILKLRSVRLVLKPRQATVSAKAGKRRVALFAATLPKGKAKLDRADTTAKLAGAKLVLTRKGAKLLRSKLAVDGIAAGKLGKLAVDAKPRSGSPGGGGPGGGGGGPESGPIKNEPPVLARPAGAVDVTSASLTWRPREAWIQYINGGEGTSVFDGVTNGPLEVKPGSSASLVYSFLGFPFASGWYHAPTGTAAIYLQGGVGFRWSDHGINFSSSKPEIEINGAASRAIFTFNGTESTKYDNQRGVLVDLHPNPIQTPPGGTVTYTDIPATIPSDTGASVFAGFYAADTPFGTMTLSFTTP
jgi:hypothetical protein